MRKNKSKKLIELYFYGYVYTIFNGRDIPENLNKKMWSISEFF